VQLDVGQTRMVVDHRVRELVAVRPLAIGVGRAAISGERVARPHEAGVARDVHMQQVAGAGPLVAVGGLARCPRCGRQRVAAQHLPHRLMRHADRAGHQPRPPAGQLARLTDPLLELRREPTGTPPGSAGTVAQAAQGCALGRRRGTPAPHPDPRRGRRDVARRRRSPQRCAALHALHQLEAATRREPRVRVLHPGLRKSVSFSNPQPPGRPGQLFSRSQRP
jgi:hypothetical protein